MSVAQHALLGLRGAVPMTQYTIVTDASGNTPGMWVYSGDAQQTKFNDPVDLPAVGGGLLNLAVGGDKKRIAVANNATSGSLSIYDITTDPPTRTTVFNLPTGTQVQDIAWSDDGRYIAVALNISPYLAVYDGNNGWSRLPNPATLPDGFGAVCFNRQSSRLIVAAGMTMLIYSISGTVLTQLSSQTLTAGPNDLLEFSDDGTLLVAGTVNAVNSFDSWTVTGSGTVFTKNTSPATAKGFNARDVAISPDKSLIALVGSSSPYLAVYNYPAMTKLANPPTLPSNVVDGCCFNPDGTELLMVLALSGSVEGYKTASWSKFTRALGITSPVWRIATVQR